MLDKHEGGCTVAAVDYADEVEGPVVWEDEECTITDFLLALSKQCVPRLRSVDKGVDGIAVSLARVDVLIGERHVLDAIVLINGEGSVNWRDDEWSVLMSLGCVQDKGTWLGGKMHDRNLVEARGLSDVALACFVLVWLRFLRVILHRLVVV
jgi:hypothetical protein